MNRRILKKHCKRAMEILIAEHGYRPEDFSPAIGDETLDAPTNMEPRFQRRGWLEPGPLPGTPLLWEKTSYFENEYDCRLPMMVLDDLNRWKHFKYNQTEDEL